MKHCLVIKPIKVLIIFSGHFNNFPNMEHEVLPALMGAKRSNEKLPKLRSNEKLPKLPLCVLFFLSIPLFLQTYKRLISGHLEIQEDTKVLILTMFM